MIAHAYGCRCHIAMPDDAAQEKGLMLEALGNWIQGVLFLVYAPRTWPVKG